MLYHAQIIAAEEIGAALILLYGKILPGPCLLHQRILPAARLGAVPLVGVAAGQIGAEKTAPGIGHAHGPVHKRLQLEVCGRFGADAGDFLQGKLAGQHNAAGAQVVVHACRLVVDAVCLCADVDG